MFTDFELIQNPGSSGKLFYFITGFGHQAVIVFFVLSGFFIIRSIEHSLNNNVWSWKTYFVNRLSRLWMVLIPALVLGLLWDKTGLFLHPDYDVYNGSVHHLGYFNPHEKLDFTTFAGNWVFLQTIFVNTFGTNGALWSLSNEFWYYMAFPLIFVGFRQGKRSVMTVLCALLGIGIILGFDFFAIDNATHPAMYFLVWLLGGLSIRISDALKNSSRNGLYALLTAGILVAMLGAIRIKLLPWWLNDYSLAVVTMLLIAFLSGIDMKSTYLSRIAHFLSSMSYTLYAVHLPIAVFLSAVFFEQRAILSSYSLLIYFLVAAIILLYARIVYYLFERNTDRIKKRILQR